MAWLASLSLAGCLIEPAPACPYSQCFSDDQCGEHQSCVRAHSHCEDDDCTDDADDCDSFYCQYDCSLCPEGTACGSDGCVPIAGFGGACTNYWDCSYGMACMDGACVSSCSESTVGSSCEGGQGVCGPSDDPNGFPYCRKRCDGSTHCAGEHGACGIVPGLETVPVCINLRDDLDDCFADQQCLSKSCVAMDESGLGVCAASCINDGCAVDTFCDPQRGCVSYAQLGDDCSGTQQCAPGLFCTEVGSCSTSCAGQAAGSPCADGGGVCGQYVPETPGAVTPELICYALCGGAANDCQAASATCGMLSSTGGWRVCYHMRLVGQSCANDGECGSDADCQVAESATVGTCGQPS